MYRDSFEQCPRCGVALVDARSARGCRACGGVWLQEAVFHEMVNEMLPPRPLSRLALAVIDRGGGDPIACPECGNTMDQTSIHEVVVDRCPKQHGLWFDALELQVALQRIADPSLEPPLEEIVPAHTRPLLPQLEPPEPRPAVGRLEKLLEVADRQEDAARVGLVFTMVANGTELEVRRPVIKIGTLASAHVRIINDPAISRLHAVIEANSATNILLIDLGSASGSFVNDEKVNNARLKPGDRLRFGATELVLSLR